MSPLYISPMTNDPVTREFLAAGVFPSKLDRQIRGVDLTVRQYDDYQRVAGRIAHYRAAQLVAAKGWGSIAPEIRAQLLSRAVDQSREMARTIMLNLHPDILDAATAAKRRNFGLPGIPQELGR